MTSRRWRLLLALMICGAAAASAFAAAGVGAVKKPPIKVMVLSSWNNPLVDLGDLPTIVKDLASNLNATAGPNGRGINGQQIVVESCNDQINPNQAETCARQAVSDGVVALIGGFSIWGSRIFPVLEAAGIPWIGNFAYQANDLTSDYSFPASPGPLVNFAPLALAGRSCKRTALIVQDASYASGAPYYTGGLKSQQRDAVATIRVPSSATDMAPYLAQAKAANPDCLYLGLGEPQMIQLIPPLSTSGLKVRVYTIAGTALTQRIISQFPQQVQGWIAVGYYPTLDQPVWAKYRAILAKYNNLGKDTPNAGGSSELRNAVGFNIFAQVASQLKGNVTSAKLFAQLNKSCKIDTGGEAPVFNFCKPHTDVPELKRLFDTSFTFQIIKSGKLVMLSRTFQDMLPNYLRSKG